MPWVFVAVSPSVNVPLARLTTSTPSTPTTNIGNDPAASDVTETKAVCCAVFGVTAAAGAVVDAAGGIDNMTSPVPAWMRPLLNNGIVCF